MSFRSRGLHCGGERTRQICRRRTLQPSMSGDILKQNNSAYGTHIQRILSVYGQHSADVADFKAGISSVVVVRRRSTKICIAVLGYSLLYHFSTHGSGDGSCACLRRGSTDQTGTSWDDAFFREESSLDDESSPSSYTTKLISRRQKYAK